MALQATGPIKYSEIQAEFGSPAANTTTTSYTVPWSKWTPQTAWVKSSLGGGNASTPNWSQFMVDYAVYPSNTDPLIGTHTAIWRIGGGSMSFSGLPADTYTLECQSDNNSTFTWDETFLGALTAVGSETTSTTFTITNTQVTEHYLTASVTNVDNGGGWSTNPAGVAWQLKNSSGTVIRSSTDSFNYDHASTGWGTFLNTYAVYPSTTDSLTGTWYETTYLFNTNSSTTYDFEAIGDSEYEIYLYDPVENTETSWMDAAGSESCNIGSCSKRIGAALYTNVTYRLRLRVRNGASTSLPTDSWLHNPGGVGFTIKDGSGTIIKTSLNTGFQGSITTSSGSVRFGNYRMDNASEFGGMIVPLDTDCGANSNVDIPTGTNPISFSNFYNARLNIGVDYFTADENRPVDAVTRFGDPSKRKIVGGFIGYPVDTSSSKVALVVNKTISGNSAGANGASVNECSLRTGSGWIAGTKVTVQVGSSGRIYGAGGDGGRGANVKNDNDPNSTGPNGLPFDENGANGENGTSALGVQYDNTVIKVRSGGKIVSGFGGGGGGAAAFEGSSNSRGSAGGGGGGGAGSPVGAGGVGGDSQSSSSNNADGSDGSDGSVPDSGEQGGAGGASGGCTGSTPPFNQSGGECESRGGAGGKGRDEETTGTGYDNDGTAQGGYTNPSGRYQRAGTPGNGGGDGAAIRRTSGYTVTITNDGTIGGETTATGVS